MTDLIKAKLEENSVTLISDATYVVLPKSMFDKLPTKTPRWFAATFPHSDDYGAKGLTITPENATFINWKEEIVVCGLESLKEILDHASPSTPKRPRLMLKEKPCGPCRRR